MNRVSISFEENMQRPSYLDEYKKMALLEFVMMVLEKLKMNHKELSIFFCTDSYIQKLNKEYRNIDSPTDVLSFEDRSFYKDKMGKWQLMGDIVISVESLPKNALYFEVSENEELKRLLIHGILHLKGLDHGEEHVEKNKMPQCKMLKVQKKLMDFFEEEDLL